MRYILIPLFLFMLSTGTTFGQDDREIDIIDINQTSETTPKDIPFAVIEKVPVYPGCTGESNKVLKKCMSDHIAAYLSKNFRIKKASKGLKPGIHRVFVSFKIDKTGKITNIKSRAPNAALEKEAIRVMKKLPKLQPGQQKGKAVGVLYSLPITFEKEKKKRN